MSQDEELYELRLKISDNADRIKYLLENVLFKSEDGREKFIFISTAVDFIKEIKQYSERIGIILKH